MRTQNRRAPGGGRKDPTPHTAGGRKDKERVHKGGPYPMHYWKGRIEKGFTRGILPHALRDRKDREEVCER